MTTEETTEVLEINVNELTLGDLEDFELKVGIDFRSISGRQAGELPLKALIALVWLIKRKTNPDYTYEDARNIKIETLGTIDLKDTGANPTQPADASTS